MFRVKNVLNINDNLIQFLQGNNLEYFTVWVGFTDEELAFFEIHFETPCIFRVNFEFGQSNSCC